jgi:hypothetical protein
VLYESFVVPGVTTGVHDPGDRTLDHPAPGRMWESTASFGWGSLMVLSVRSRWVLAQVHVSGIRRDHKAQGEGVSGKAPAAARANTAHVPLRGDRAAFLPDRGTRCLLSCKFVDLVRNLGKIIDVSCWLMVAYGT